MGQGSLLGQLAVLAREMVETQPWTKCAYCGKDVINPYVLAEWKRTRKGRRKLHSFFPRGVGHKNVGIKDHVIPQSAGGHDWRHNRVVACHLCDRKKKNKIGFPDSNDSRLTWVGASEN